MRTADAQLALARKNGEVGAGDKILRIAAFHHPVTGNEKIVDDAFLEQLREAEVRLCLHGHVHEIRADVVF